jgi:hypothetical protein
MHSGDSAKASSALQLLETRIPDHDPGLGVLFCAATAREAAGKSIKRDKKKYLVA